MPSSAAPSLASTRKRSVMGNLTWLSMFRRVGPCLDHAPQCFAHGLDGVAVDVGHTVAHLDQDRTVPRLPYEALHPFGGERQARLRRIGVAVHDLGPPRLAHPASPQAL